jgi:hypothetical protein
MSMLFLAKSLTEPTIIEDSFKNSLIDGEIQHKVKHSKVKHSKVKHSKVKHSKLKHSKENNIDNYTSDVLRQRYKMFKDSCIETSKFILTGLPIRHQNPPEDITENIVKEIIKQHDNDPSCKWAKGIGEIGDLYSDNYSTEYPIEVKSFMSDGPSSFGPTKKFGVIYFLDIRLLLKDTIILWKVNVTNESPEWNQIKMNKSQTHEDQCKEMRRPRISWENIYSQIPDKCVKIYEGSFEGIFIPKIMPSIDSRLVQSLE